MTTSSAHGVDRCGREREALRVVAAGCAAHLSEPVDLRRLNEIVPGLGLARG